MFNRKSLESQELGGRPFHLPASFELVTSGRWVKQDELFSVEARLFLIVVLISLNSHYDTGFPFAGTSD